MPPRKELFMEIFSIVFCCLLILVLGILFEYLLHPEYSVTECARSLKATVYAALVGLFGSATRHTFDDSLETGLLKTISAYRNTAFEPTLKAAFLNQVPCIVISFISNDILPEEELSKINRLIRLKFSHYLSGYNKAWHYFTVYHTADNFIKFFIFYSELPEDKQAFFKHYQREVKQKSTPSHGILRDEALDKELRHGQY